MREKPLILIVDDEPEIIEVVRTKLGANGFEVKEATKGTEGINLAQELKPDIILLDVVMPEMDGVEVLFKLKSNKDTKNIKVFLFTGKGDPRPEILEINRKFALESGAVDFIRKEIELNELVVKLQKTITEMNQGNSSKIKKEELPKKRFFGNDTESYPTIYLLAYLFDFKIFFSLSRGRARKFERLGRQSGHLCFQPCQLP